MSYDVAVLSQEETRSLLEIRDGLRRLAAGCEVPSVQAAARAALAQIEQALNGQGLSYQLYSEELGPPRI